MHTLSRFSASCARSSASLCFAWASVTLWDMLSKAASPATSSDLGQVHTWAAALLSAAQQQHSVQGLLCEAGLPSLAQALSRYAWAAVCLPRGRSPSTLTAHTFDGGTLSGACSNHTRLTLNTSHLSSHIPPIMRINLLHTSPTPYTHPAYHYTSEKSYIQTPPSITRYK